MSSDDCAELGTPGTGVSKSISLELIASSDLGGEMAYARDIERGVPSVPNIPLVMMVPGVWDAWDGCCKVGFISARFGTMAGKLFESYISETSVIGIVTFDALGFDGLEQLQHEPFKLPLNYGDG